MRVVTPARRNSSAIDSRIKHDRPRAHGAAEYALRYAQSQRMSSSETSRKAHMRATTAKAAPSCETVNSGPRIQQQAIRQGPTWAANERQCIMPTRGMHERGLSPLTRLWPLLTSLVTAVRRQLKKRRRKKFSREFAVRPSAPLQADWRAAALSAQSVFKCQQHLHTSAKA